jgi:hypothetical protein
MADKSIEDLIAEGRRHDAAMTPGPWVSAAGFVEMPGGEFSWCQESDEQDGCANADGIAWMRTHLCVLLDMCLGQRHAAEHYGTQVAVVSKMHNEVADRLQTVTRERDEARAECDRLRAELQKWQSPCVPGDALPAGWVCPTCKDPKCGDVL